MLKSIPLILLAAGKSSRMGSPKGLVPFKNKTLLEFQIEGFLSAGGQKIIVVLGNDFLAYKQTLSWIAKALEGWTPYKNGLVKVLINSEPELGQFSSIQIACKELLVNDKCSASFILPIDVPIMAPNIWKKLDIAMGPKIKVCQLTFHSHGGHPVLISSELMKDLTEVNVYESIARLDTQINLLNPENINKIEIDDENILLNINTPEDLKNNW